MAKKIVFSTDLQTYRPLIWYGEPVYARFQQLSAVLREGLGDMYADFLTEPIVKDGRGSWLGEFIGVPFPQLQTSEQENARLILQGIITEIKNFANKLQEGDAMQKQLGELLLLAMEVPDLDKVYVQGKNLQLVLWGFSSEQSKKNDFRLETKISVPVTATNSIVDSDKDSLVNQSNNPPDFNKEIVDNQSISGVSTDTTNSIVPPSPPPFDKSFSDLHDGNKDNSKKTFGGWFWFVIGALVMLLIMLALWFLLGRKAVETGQYLPINRHRVIPPVDTAKIVIDTTDPGKRKVFSDKVNLALNRGEDMETFAKYLHDNYSDDLEIVYFDTAIMLMQVETPEGEWRAWRDKLKKHKSVRLAFSNTLFSSDALPNDVGFRDEQASWYFKEIQAEKAWTKTTGDESLIVAVVDNGFDLTHPEIKDKVVNPYNLLTGDDNLFPCSGEGGSHGTHVAGTAVGTKDNTLGLCGIAPNCRLMPVQIGDADGNMQTISVAAGILYALHHNAKVINLSLGSYFGDDITSLSESEQREIINAGYSDESDFWNELFEFCREQDIVLVLAAGNQNILAGIDPFARSTKALIVSAYAGESDVKADFSNYGEYSTISAPGVNIYSSVPGGGFGYLQGTSMAAPIVTGAAALLRSANSSMSSQDVINALVKTAKPLQSSRYIGPLIQIADALDYKPDSLLNIPSDARNTDFAIGKWKSTSNLTSDSGRVNVELYFDIKPDATGTVTFVEQDGAMFSSPIDVIFSDGKLLLKQRSEAVNSQNGETYFKYNYTCSQEQGQDKAVCVAQSQEQENNVIDFYMKKIN